MRRGGMVDKETQQKRDRLYIDPLFYNILILSGIAPFLYQILKYTRYPGEL